MPRIILRIAVALIAVTLLSVDSWGRNDSRYLIMVSRTADGGSKTDILADFREEWACIWAASALNRRVEDLQPKNTTAFTCQEKLIP